MRQIKNQAFTWAVLAASWASVAAASEVKVEATDSGARVTIDGKPFAEYLVRHGHQPIIWPIIGPGGQAMTRQYPMGEKLPGEVDDHPHHRSLWFSHGMVNGLDFWLEPEDRGPHGGDNQIVHREFVAQESGENGRIVTHNDWMSNGVKVCEDERTIIFGADEHGRWIDFAVEVTASEGDLTFGDTKEGAFAFRVAGTMSVDAHKGGRIRNSRGQVDAVAWGQSAEWVDYTGPVDGATVGITVFDLPDSFRHPTRWHVRTYGLYAANPFGQRDFPADEHQQGEAKIKAGERLRLHYRVLLHEDELDADRLAAISKAYSGASEP